MQSKKMLQATITVPGNQAHLEKIFSMEEHSFQNERASYSYENKGTSLVFNISAKDSTALRSVLNTITKIITVHEKAKKVVKNEE